MSPAPAWQARNSRREIAQLASNKQIGLLYEAWADLDRVIEGLDAPTATRSLAGGTSIAWAVAHVTAQVDSWVNVRLAGLSPNRVISDTRFSLNGSGVPKDDWQLILGSIDEVRGSARQYLDNSPPMDTLTSYMGSLEYLRESGITLRYAALKMSAHHYFHIGEISTRRDLLGHSVGDYPGRMSECH